MLASERRIYIMNCLNNKGIVNLKEIAAEMNISEITVRRDFEKLEKAGKLKRVQGGAALEDVLDGAELTMKEKMNLHTDVKRRVAAKAAEFVKDGDCVFLDTGTSIAPIIDDLASRQITIVTCNQLVTRKLVRPVAEVFILGGRYLPHYNMTAGAIAQQELQQYNFDVAFIGCSSIDLEEGFGYTMEMESNALKNIAMQESSRNVLIIDSSKIQKRAFLKFAALDRFDTILCNRFETEVELPENFCLVD